MLLKQSPEDFCVREFLVPAFGQSQHNLYLLRKREWNTEDCIGWLSEQLRIPRKRFGTCGNKDKRAITEQYVTITGAPQTIRTPDGFTLTYLATLAQPLHLGAHERNVFTITVRDLDATARMQPLRRVRNYFGEQRFSKENDTIGFHLLRKDYKAAATALGLTFTTDPISALRSLPKHTLLLYVHAAQSRLWNDALAALPDEELSETTTVMLPGYGEPVNDAMRAALEQRSLTEECFVNRTIPELSVEGIPRAALQDVRDLTASMVHDGVCVIHFSLPTGQYATETVRQLFLNSDT